MERKNKEHVIIVGLGYVGLPLSVLAVKKGYRVTGIDIVKDRVRLINNGKPHFADPVLAGQLKRYPVHASASYNSIREADIVLICVPTPVFKNHKPDLNPVKLASREVGKNLRKNTLVILESTYNPGTTRKIVLPLLEKHSKLKAGRDFFLSYCPERINPGDKKWNLTNLPRVIGSLNKTGLQKALKFYRSIIDAKIVPLNTLEEAEAVKVFENCFRDVNIALVNEFARSFDCLGISFENVLKGAATKPFSMLPHYPGCGVGGQCIPVDPYYMIEFARKNGFNHSLLKTARVINNKMPLYTVNLLQESLHKINKNLKGALITLLGLAYKENNGNISESPSLYLLEILKKKGAKIKIYDPHVPSYSSTENLNKSLKGADAVILATSHSEFKIITHRLLAELKIKILIDGRNFFNKSGFEKAGIIYRGIGRL